MWQSSKYLETTVTNKNYIHKEIKRTLNSGNVYFHSVQSPVFPSPLQKHKD